MIKIFISNILATVYLLRFWREKINMSHAATCWTFLCNMCFPYFEIFKTANLEILKTRKYQNKDETPWPQHRLARSIATWQILLKNFLIKIFENDKINLRKAMDRMATSQSSETLKTKHKNSILEVNPIPNGFSTAGSDGNLITWNTQSLARKFQEMKI